MLGMSTYMHQFLFFCSSYTDHEGVSAVIRIQREVDQESGLAVPFQVLHGCQIFLGTTYQNGEKCTKKSFKNYQMTPMNNKIDQMDSIFHCKPLENYLPKLGFLV
jgi:hypothetical protein